MAENMIAGAYTSKKLYLCDPEKNKSCRKTACQTDCFHTSKKQYSKDGQVYHYNCRTRQIETKESIIKAAAKEER